MFWRYHHFRKPPYGEYWIDQCFHNLVLTDFVCDIFSIIVFWLIPTIAWGLNRGYQGELRNPKSGLLGFRAHRYCTLLQKRPLLCWPLLSPRYNPAPSKTPRFLLARWEHLPSGQQNSCWHGKPMYYRYQQQEQKNKEKLPSAASPQKNPALSKATNKNPKKIANFFHLKKKNQPTKTHGEKNPKETNNNFSTKKSPAPKKVPDFKTGTEVAKAEGVEWTSHHRSKPISKPPPNGGWDGWKVRENGLGTRLAIFGGKSIGEGEALFFPCKVRWRMFFLWEWDVDVWMKLRISF